MDPHDEDRILEGYLEARTVGGEQGLRPRAGELSLIEVFADLVDLGQNRPADAEQNEGESQLHSAHEYFHTYLQSLDVERARLPESFQAALGKALAHYGITDLTRSPELEAAVFRIFLARQRAATDATVVL